LLDELSKGESEIETVKELFHKMRNEFGETKKEKRKIEQLRTIEQRGRTCDEYVQEFKKVARGSSYKRWPFIEEFKRGLSRALRKKLAEAEIPPSIIEEWQERAVRLDRNQRQSRVEKRMLGRNVAHPQGNVQPRGSFGGGSYRGRGGQIMWRAEGQNFREGAQGNQGRQGLGRDPNMIDVDRGKGENRTYYIYVENRAIWPKTVGRKRKETTG